MQIKEYIGEKVSSPEKAAAILKAILSKEDKIDRDKEHFWVIGLTTRNSIKYIELATLGVLDKSVIGPREVFRLAISKGVKSIIVGHNHPSGERRPSPDDSKTTKALKEAGVILDIPVLDHVIIANDQHFSLKEEGMI